MSDNNPIPPDVMEMARGAYYDARAAWGDEGGTAEDAVIVIAQALQEAEERGYLRGESNH